MSRWPSRAHKRQVAASEQSIAVLRFTSAAEQYFSDGIAKDIVTALHRFWSHS
jgi:TolB-like protein